ncbi:S41 family peptidase [Lutibacter sp.]|uniref:S41 family peptidase n=1 Tax=Lutibacter sp. TaxID=1925666 RepID=UPI001A2DECAC|nr:S41 family peptidase [Lutibacter sp.]MBI9040827.1 S41 family peptidase [Lutibacter sp.]
MSRLKKWIIGVFVVVSISISVGFQSGFFEIAKQIDIYTTVFKELNMLYIDEVNPAELTHKSINHMLQSLDPYTVYFDEQGIEDARIAATGEYGGIGTLVDFKEHTLLVKELLKDSPAESAGIKPGDKILKIDAILVKDFDEKGASTLLNGLPNTKVTLLLERQNKTFEVTVTRKKVDVSPVPYYTMLNDEVGYISFIQFTESAAAEVKKAFLDLKDQGMKKLIIDVRSNPGGLLNEAVKITNFFIPKDKVVVTTKGKIEKFSETFKTKEEPLDLEMPISILIDGKSASASEILAGSLQDYDRAIIVGERSFGKGLVQQYRELSYGTQMKLTISKYYTPSGRCIQELDYTNRDDQGNVPKFSDKGREQYKTSIGRIVYGGGGILPDVNFKKPATTKTTETLLKSDALFNYVTTYFYAHKTIEEPSKFNVSANEYANLRVYLATNQQFFETETEAEFKKANKKALSENLQGSLSKSYAEVLATIQAEKLKELDKNKEEIIEKLTEEIVKRYYFVEGVYQQKAQFDPVISKAVGLLNSSEYQKILKK